MRMLVDQAAAQVEQRRLSVPVRSRGWRRRSPRAGVGTGGARHGRGRSGRSSPRSTEMLPGVCSASQGPPHPLTGRETDSRSGAATPRKHLVERRVDVAALNLTPVPSDRGGQRSSAASSYSSLSLPTKSISTRSPVHEPLRPANRSSPTCRNRIDRAMIGHGIAEVSHRRGEARRKPDRIHAKSAR
jgi:hypothetical protein